MHGTMVVHTYIHMYILSYSHYMHAWSRVDVEPERSALVRLVVGERASYLKLSNTH